MTKQLRAFAGNGVNDCGGYVRGAGPRAMMRWSRLAGCFLVASLFWSGTMFALEPGGDALEAHYRLVRGKQLYEQYCRVCHGERGKGSGYAFATTRPADLTGPAVRDRTDAELLATIHGGSPGTDMAAWNWALSDRQKADVVAYIRTLAE